MAYSLDAATQELIFVAGPLVVLIATTVADPAAGLVTAGILGLTGSLWFATAAPARRWRGTATVTHWVGPLRSAPLARLLIALLFVGATIGAFTVAITAYAEQLGTPSVASWLIAANALGALAGGLAYTTASAAANHHRRLQLLLCALALGYAPLMIQTSTPGTMLLAILSGLALPPVLACSFTLIAQLAPEGTITEAHAWMITAFGAGNATGSALAGLAADTASSRLALATSVIMALLALLATAPPLVRAIPRRASQQ
ncbi:MFS transporter [Allosaccharopolyspora coralli]|uniref:MFS transporter n=1 Tax=Allosaccharopolyspora coralli TaxID=2665642 RepID=UPI001651C798|nr:MFS transporter [Allosaccharopolyspora coralli]